MTPTPDLRLSCKSKGHVFLSIVKPFRVKRTPIAYLLRSKPKLNIPIALNTEPNSNTFCRRKPKSMLALGEIKLVYRSWIPNDLETAT